MQSKVMAALGVLLAVLVILTSAAVNARYGMSLAREGFDQHVMMAVAIFADLTKAVAWIFLLGAVARRQVLSSLAAAVVFLSCLTYAVGGSIGYVASLRAQSSAVVVDRAKEVDDLDAAIKRKQEERDRIGTVTAASVVGKQLEGKRQDWRFSSSERCTKATATASRTFCAELAGLEAEEQKALEAERLDRELAGLSAQRTGYRGTAKVEKGDYQGAMIAHLTQWNVSNIQLGLALLFVLVVEGGACFMLGLALNHWSAGNAPRLDGNERREEKAVAQVRRVERLADMVVSETREVALPEARGESMPVVIEAAAEERSPVATVSSPASSNVVALPSEPRLASAHPKDFVAFAERRLEFVAGGRIGLGELKAAYVQWCGKERREALEGERLARTIAQMVSELGITEDGEELVGVRMKSASRRRAG